MNELNKEIIPGVGVGDIKFGITRDELLVMLGEPNVIDRFSYIHDGEDWTETWEYNNLGLSFGFDEDNDWRLSLITISSRDFEFGNRILIGLSKDDLKNIISDMNVFDLIYENCPIEEAPTHELLSSDSLGMNFWFDDDEVSEVQLGPLFFDPNTIRWPD